MEKGLGAARTVLGMAIAAALLAAALAWSAPAEAAPGGIGSTSSEEEETAAAKVGRATLVGGKAIAPLNAPAAVQRVIQAANRIRTKPYVWGGGHASWNARGYDCSGSVSYALHGGSLLNTPLVSGSFMRWGAAGPGRWITIYANGGHVYAVIAGLRWDTSGNASGTGPRWHLSTAARSGFAVRHPVGY
jgi:cell wall-associated NlpC family hydrolase